MACSTPLSHLGAPSRGAVCCELCTWVTLRGCSQYTPRSSVGYLCLHWLLLIGNDCHAHLGQALEIIRGCQGLNVVGCDLVEVSPPYDLSGNTALLAANLLFEMLCALPKVTTV
ncbi:agmatine ureohydrolase (agmatinase), isoform CRA_c [Rattus norvegicus]|uniref:Agmatine ureohydrolase (Agmatinase), isoform CRA_c n=1 Tax=Rattus norvegicus TaxID=10116 RepID=A6ITV9_RAT|nr:agmatine ureohydrolase (agmatinase), isoform CRA_c [Rattus norvegicus]